MTPKYDEIKRQSLFLRSSPEFYKTNWVADSSTGLRISSNKAAFITLLRNPDTTAAFYIARQEDSTSTCVYFVLFCRGLRTKISTFSATTTFKLNVTIAGASLQIPVVAPAITLGGKQSKLIITDYSFGTRSKLSYSTAQIFYASTIDNRDVLFLYGDPSQEHEVALRLTGTPNNLKLHNQSSLVQISTKSPGLTEGTTMINFLPGIEGLITVWDSDTQLVLFADSKTTATFWSPVIAGKSDDPLRNFWGLGTNQSILVGGPYLVRDASLVGSKLALRGDLKTDVRLTVIAPKGIKSITWNGENVSGDVAAAFSITQFGGFVGQLELRKAVTGIEIPKLSWKFKDSLPEIQNSFNDDSWTIANRTTTNVPLKPYYGDGRILYGCDYGLSVTFSSFSLENVLTCPLSCENVVLWRGHFKATGFEKSLNLSINGGEGIYSGHIPRFLELTLPSICCQCLG